MPIPSFSFFKKQNKIVKSVPYSCLSVVKFSNTPAGKAVRELSYKLLQLNTDRDKGVIETNLSSSPANSVDLALFKNKTYVIESPRPATDRKTESLSLDDI